MKAYHKFKNGDLVEIRNLGIEGRYICNTKAPHLDITGEPLAVVQSTTKINGDYHYVPFDVLKYKPE